MVIERAELPIAADKTLEFERAFEAVGHLLRKASGCRGMHLSRGIETPSKYLLLIKWDSVAAHRAFTEKSEFNQFRSSIGPYFAGKPATEHFEPIDGA
jgi:heme-degrading monooxygenase HmoA